MTHLMLILALLWQHVPMGAMFPTAAPPSFAVIQSVNTASGVYSAAITPGATGRLLVGTAIFGTTCSASSASVSDTAGNTWVIDKLFNDTALTTYTFMIFHALANGTSSTTITVNPNVTCFAGSVAFAEVSGVNTFDVANSSTSSPASDPTITLATNHSGEFCAVSGYSDNAFSPFVLIQNMNGVVAGAQFVGGASTGTSTTFTSAVNYFGWSLVGACYK